MRTVVFLFAVLFAIPGISRAQENMENRKMCLTILPILGILRADLVGPLDLKNPVGSGLSVVAHTRRGAALNCVFLYKKPTPTYFHTLLDLDTDKVVMVRLAPVDSGIVDLENPAFPK